MKIAIFLPNWIGDAVMATPTLRAVRTKFADAEIIAVMRPYVAEVLNGLDLVDRHLLHEPRAKGSRNRGWRFVKRLRQERFDLALLLPNSQRCAWLARLSGAKRWHARSGGRFGARLGIVAVPENIDTDAVDDEPHAGDEYGLIEGDLYRGQKPSHALPRHEEGESRE